MLTSDKVKSNTLALAGVLASFFLCACAIFPNERAYNDFYIVEPGMFDTLSSIAERYLGDSSKAWVISSFNQIDAVTQEHELVIPRKPFNLGGLKSNGYQTLPVLAYHSFSKSPAGKMSVTQTAFEKQMRYLKENDFHVITLDQLMDFLEFKDQIPERSVVITIDNGWLSTHEIAFPILKRYGFPATLFIYTDFIGGKKALTWKQIKILAENGFDIQNQTQTYRNLTKKKKGENLAEYIQAIEREITNSQDIIQNKVNKTCTYLAYPYGETNSLVVALLKKHGYRGGFTVRRGSNPFFIDNYAINRSMILAKDDMETFKKQLTIFNDIPLK